MRKTVIILFTAMLFLLLPMQSSLAKEWTFKTTEDVNKGWKIGFNMKLDTTTVSQNNVYVTDGKTTHPTTLQVVDNGKAIEIRPTISYQPGKQYRIIVSAAIKSTEGKALKSPIEVPFEVVDPTAKIKSIYSVNNQTITSLTITTSDDVFDLKIGSESLRYIGNNTYEHILIDANPGSSVTIYAYDENNKRIETKKYTLPN